MNLRTGMTPEGRALLRQLVSPRAYIEIAQAWQVQALAQQTIHDILTGKVTDVAEARSALGDLHRLDTEADSRLLTLDLGGEDRELVGHEVGVIAGLIQALELVVQTLLDTPRPATLPVSHDNPF